MLLFDFFTIKNFLLSFFLSFSIQMSSSLQTMMPNCAPSEFDKNVSREEVMTNENFERPDMQVIALIKLDLPKN